MNEITALIKETPVSPFYPVITQREDSYWWARNWALTTHQIFQHLDRGLAASRTVRVNVVDKAPSLWYFVSGPNRWKQLLYWPSCLSLIQIFIITLGPQIIQDNLPILITSTKSLLPCVVTFTGIKTWTYLEAIIKPTITRSGEARIQTPRSAWQQRLSCESPGQQEYPWHLISREEDAWALQPAGRWILIQPGPKLTQVVANLLDYHPHASVWSIYLAEQGRLWALKSDSSRFHSAQWPLPALWPWAWI